MVMDLLGVAPFAIVTAGMGWIGSAWMYRDKQRKEQVEHDERLEVHRDGLTFELLQAARSEVTAAYVEVKSLREEVKTKQNFEQHFYYYQQALDHLEAVLFADTPELRLTAERAAKAFVNRMRRLSDAKGALRNEAQIEEAAVQLARRKPDDGEKS